MPIHVLINPQSGTVRARGADIVEHEIVAALARAGHRGAVIFGGALELKAAAARLAENMASDLVISVGGDGTVAAIAEALIGSSLPLLPLPGGTMNLFVRDMQIPDAASDALSIILAGGRAAEPRHIDLGLVRFASGDERAFVNNVVFGAYGNIADAREDLRKAETAAETMDAIADVADAVFRAEPRRYVLTGDGIDQQITSNILMVANNIYTGADLLRPVRHRLDEGTLGVYLADSLDGPDLVMRLAEALAGRLADSPSVHVTQVTDCVVASDSEMRLAIDGDPLEEPGPIKLRTLPGALRVIAPPLPLNPYVTPG